MFCKVVSVKTSLNYQVHLYIKTGIDGDIVASKFKPSSEVSYKTTFGMIRMDRDNKPKYHGQFDDDIPPAETDDFSLSRNSTQTIDASNTLQYAGVTTMKKTVLKFFCSKKLTLFEFSRSW